MPSILVPSVMLHRNPTFKPALDALIVYLLERDYSNHARWSIYDHAATHGTLAGTPYLEPDDEAQAEAIFVGALPEIPFDAECWGREDVFMDARMLADGTHPEPFGDGPDAPDDPEFFGPTRLQALGLMPISGGSPADEEPYPLPTPADLAEYDEWSRALDDCGDWPRPKTAADVRADRADVIDFYRTHPDA